MCEMLLDHTESLVTDYAWKRNTTMAIKSHTDSYTQIVGDFNIPLLSTDKFFIQKLNREILELDKVVKQMDLRDI